MKLFINTQNEIIIFYNLANEKFVYYRKLNQSNGLKPKFENILKINPKIGVYDYAVEQSNNDLGIVKLQ